MGSWRDRDRKVSRLFPTVKAKGAQLGTCSEGAALCVGRGLQMTLRAVVFCPWLRWMGHGHVCKQREDMPPVSALWLWREGSQRQGLTRPPLFRHTFVLGPGLAHWGYFSRRLTKANWHHRSLGG